MNQPERATLRNIDLFGDLPVPLEVRLGYRTVHVQDIAGLKTGSTIVLDKPAGETLDILVGNVKLASAEVVVIEDRMAVRITEFDYEPAPRLG